MLLGSNRWEDVSYLASKMSTIKEHAVWDKRVTHWDGLRMLVGDVRGKEVWDCKELCQICNMLATNYA